MMEASPIIFDLSSDDDEATSAWEEPKGDDYSWLSEVLEAVDKVFNDPDDVVVVGEANPTKKSKSPNSVVGKDADDDDDGDCVVLEGDPDKALSDLNDLQEDSDECRIVGQKGQIACRDYPHPRHDCAKFPFSSTSHEQHCELCHCFVCDSKAPCSYWGLGTCDTDHCHATDKGEKWKNLRKTFRHVRNFPLSVTKAPVTSHSVAMPRLNRAPGDNMQFTLQNQVSRVTPTRAARNCIPQPHIQQPSFIRACSSTRYGVPYNPSVGSQRVLNRRTMHPHQVSHQLLGVHSAVIRRNRGIKVSNLGPQFVSSNTMSKRMEVAPTKNRTAYVPLENITSSIASQHQQDPASLTISNERNSNPIGWPNFCSGSTVGTYTHQSSSQPRIDIVTNNSVPSQSSAFGQPVPQSSLDQDTNHLQNQNQPATNHAFSDYDLNWVNNISQSNQQASVYSQLQSSTNEKEASKEVTEGDKSVFNELESFLFDDQSFPEDSLTAELNSLAPNHMPYDTGMIFFDIDTSWDRLTSA